MSKVTRFGVSVEDELLKEFDKLLGALGYTNRSEAIRDLIRDRLVGDEWAKSAQGVTGVISLVYDHHKRELIKGLTHLQHDYSNAIISTQHVHLDHHNCLEVVIVKGRARDISALAERLRSLRGVKHGGLIMTTTGKGIG